jgi:arsenate reductase (thioredoxin)
MVMEDASANQCRHTRAVTLEPLITLLHMKKILIIGEENACRSQMAEGWMRYYTKNHAEVVSAGLTQQPVDLFAANSMSMAVLDISKQTSKTLEAVNTDEFDFVLYVFEPASADGIAFKGAPKVIVTPFEKPQQGASTKETDASYARVRDEIENYCFDFVHQYIRKLY